MTQLKPGDKVKLVGNRYNHDNVGAVYYVVEEFYGGAYLTNNKNLATPAHTFKGNGDFCLCYPSSWFEPLKEVQSKGFVSHIRKLDKLKGVA